MRFNFDISDDTDDQPKPKPTRKPLSSLTPLTPPTPQTIPTPSLIPPSPQTQHLQWLPLQDHPVFSQPSQGGAESGGERMGRNLMAWDGVSRVYKWDNGEGCLHRVSVRLGEPDERSVIAGVPAKVLKPDQELDFVVNKISVNRNGSAVILAGSNGLCVMNLFGHTSKKDGSILCRTVPICLDVYLDAIRILQVAWHPCSDVHIGVLSSDSVFRVGDCEDKTDQRGYGVIVRGCDVVDEVGSGLRSNHFEFESPPVGLELGSVVLRPTSQKIFDLSSTSEKPEQEYYLQPTESRNRSQKASSICPADFSFGTDHLWDKFSVFILFADGSLYVLCPVVPFGCRLLHLWHILKCFLLDSGYMWESVFEMYADVQALGSKSASQTTLKYCNRAMSWLESTFPELKQVQGQKAGGLSAVKARAYAPIDASLLLQGPLRKLCGEEDDNGVNVAECKGRALSLVYSCVGKDSILATAWSSGQLQIDALADEVQPVWRTGNPHRLCIDSQDQILGFAMICESISDPLPVVRLNKPLDNGDWLGHSPPLLRLAIVDLALPTVAESNLPVSLYIDPLDQMKIYAVHHGGVDSVLLHFLPFSQNCSKDGTLSAPSVEPVLSTFQGLSNSVSYVCGFVILTDSYGSSWIAGTTSTHGGFVLETKSWEVNYRVFLDMIENATCTEEPTVIDTPHIVSKAILKGPKMLSIPRASISQRSVLADSIEGRSTMHQFVNLFHENYVEYAHKVYIELMHHLPYMKKNVHVLHDRLNEARQKLSNIEEQQPKINARAQRALLFHNSLEDRLRRLRSLPGMHKRPLYKAELQFKEELGTFLQLKRGKVEISLQLLTLMPAENRFRSAELDALHSLIETLNTRVRRFSQSPKSSLSSLQRRPHSRNSDVQGAQLDLLKSALQKLSLVNSENSKKVKFVESAIKKMEDES
ncbi:Nuclear pore complex protein NUP88-like protein [Drosera capensis]